MKFKKLTGLLLLTLCASAGAAEHPELRAFPPAQEGMTRFVIVLPDKDRGEEDNFMVELVAGKEILTDGVNEVGMDARIDPRPLTGWGYTYYEVGGTGNVRSTLMAPPPGAEPVKRFVPGEPLRILYNSRLPVVIYAPEGFEVRYRIWSAPETFNPVEKG